MAMMGIFNTKDKKTMKEGSYQLMDAALPAKLFFCTINPQNIMLARDTGTKIKQ